MGTSRGFASDNASGVHPDVMAAIAEANAGHVHAYGDDLWTHRAEELFRREFGPDSAVYFVFNGTGANVTALQALMRTYEYAICPATAHIYQDECGAPERFTGGKLAPVQTADGKLTPALIESAIEGVGFEHHSQPRVVSITQSSEYGTVYAREELTGIAECATRHGLKLHVDGARLANGAASLGCSLAEACTGADAVSFGGTKNGALCAEAVVLLDPALADGFKYVRKQSAQLASKMRYVAAQFVALLDDGLWLRNAAHANEMAALLAREAAKIEGVRITQTTQANEVFAVVSHDAIAPLRAEFDFYMWDDATDEARWVTSWDTTEDDVTRFVAGIVTAVGA